MSYSSIADVSESGSLTRRVTAAAATEGQEQPDVWAYDTRWQWAAAPGWGDAFASAEAGGNPDPGADESVITDGMILGQVQAMLGTEPSGEPTAAWPVPQIAAWLAVRGVRLAPEALASLTVAELLDLVADLRSP